MATPRISPSGPLATSSVPTFAEVAAASQGAGDNDLGGLVLLGIDSSAEITSAINKDQLDAAISVAPYFSNYVINGIELATPDALIFDPENTANLSNGAFISNPASGLTAYSLTCLQGGRYQVIFSVSVAFQVNSGPATITSTIALDGVSVTPNMRYVRPAGDPTISYGVGALNTVLDIEADQELSIPTTIAFAGTPATAGSADGIISLVRLGDTPS